MVLGLQIKKNQIQFLRKSKYYLKTIQKDIFSINPSLI